MSWMIWMLIKRTGKYLFHVLTLCICFWRYWKYTSLLPSMLTSNSRNRRGNSIIIMGTNAATLMSHKDGDSFLRVPTRFVGEIHLVLSALVIISCIGTIISICVRLESLESYNAILFERGLLCFTIVALIISLMDTVLSFLLIYAAKQVSLNKSLIWYRSTLTILIVFSFLTIAFGVLLNSGIVVLGLLPSIIFKPFALWIVSGFIEHIYEDIRRSVPQPILPVEVFDTLDSATPGRSRSTSGRTGSSSGAFARQSSTLTATTSIGSTTTNGELYDRDEMKRKTTVFLLNKNARPQDGRSGLPGANEYVTLTRIKSLPD